LSMLVLVLTTLVQPAYLPISWAAINYQVRKC
jgi:hypothetical protein